MTDDSFLGNALNTVDAKNRVSIPAPIRDALGARGDARSIVLTPHERADCLVGYDPSYTAKARAQLAERFAGVYTDERDDILRITFGAAERASIDDNGRIILSGAMKDVAEIDRLALFVGKDETFEIWNPHRFVERPNLDPRMARQIQRMIDARGTA